MNDQEREVINDIFRRLEQVANQPRDPEAERYIADKVRQQPYAPYAMAQASVVLEQALSRLQAENDQLRAELDHAMHRPQQGGFLSSIFGGGSRPPEPAYNAPPPRQASPWGNAYQQQPPQQPLPQQPYGAPQGGMMGGAPGGPWGGGMMQPRGGGFLQGALSTAAGVAGGMMIANALSHAFGGEQGGAGGASALAGLTGSDQGGSGGPFDNASITDSLYGNPGQQPDQQDDDQQGFEDFGSQDDGDWT